VLIPVVFLLTILGVDPRRLDERRTRHLRRAVDEVVRDEVLERIAVNLANQFCTEHGITFIDLSLPDVADHFRLVEAPRSGTVTDISLRELDKLAGSTTDSTGPRAYLLTRIGADVQRGSPVAVLPAAIPSQPRKERRIARVGNVSRDDRLAPYLAQLHDESQEAIKEQRIGTYGRVVTAYQETLLALPRAWNRYHVQFTDEVASGVGLFELGILGGIERRLYDEIRLAMEGGNLEIAYTATGLPFGVAAQAVRLGATELAKRMLILQIAVYSASGQPDTESSVTEIRKSCRDSILSFVESFAIPELTRTGTRALQWNEIEALLTMSFEVVNALLKAVLEAESADELLQLDDRWSTMLQFWHPEHDYPDPPELERIERQFGSDAPELLAAKQRAEELTPRLQLRALLDRKRNLYRLGLSMWALRRLRQAPNEVAGDRFAQAFQVFARHFRDPELLVTLTGEALIASMGREPWQAWMIADIDFTTRGGFYAGLDQDFLRCFLVLLILMTDPSAGAPVLTPEGWLKHQQLLPVLEGLLTERLLWSRLGVDAVSERGEQASAALREASDAYDLEEERKLAEASAEPAKVANFINLFRNSWEFNRIAPNLFKSVQCYLSDPGPPPEGSSTNVVANDWVPKDLFIESSRTDTDLRMISSESGVRAAANEMNRFLRRIDGAPTFASGQPSFAETIRECIASMRADGYTPSAVIAAVDWGLWRDAEFDSTTILAAPSSPFGLTERTRHWVRGTVGGLPLLTWPLAPRDTVIVIDIARFGTWKQWSADADGHELAVRLESYDEQGAVEVSEKTSGLFADDRHSTVAARARRLRGQVRLVAEEAWDLVNVDLEAARVVHRPTNPGESS